MTFIANITRLALLMLCGAGFYGTWYLLMNNGTTEHMSQVPDKGPRLLPGTDEPVRTHYTGIGIVDYQLTVLDIFFWEQVDGSRPHSSLFCYHFAGQVFPGWSLMMIESLRTGNKWRVISFLAIWGIAVQTLAYAVIIPIFLVFHLSTSPTVTSLRTVDYLVSFSDIISIPLSMAIGFILPTVLMSLPAPSILNHDLKQVMIAVWQFFPLWVSIFQQALSFCLKSVGNGTNTREGSTRHSVRAMRILYGGLLLVVLINQASIAQLMATSRMFPSLFALEYRDIFNFGKVFVPKAIAASTKMDSIGSGAHLLLQYDSFIGSTSMIVWALAQLVQAHEAAAQPLKIVRWFAISLLTLALTGPLGLVVAYIWARDELVFARTMDGDKKKN